MSLPMVESREANGRRSDGGTGDGTDAKHGGLLWLVFGEDRGQSPAKMASLFWWMYHRRDRPLFGVQMALVAP